MKARSFREILRNGSSKLLVNRVVLLRRMRALHGGANSWTYPMNPASSIPALEGKIEQLVELCRRFQVTRLEIFGSAAAGAFRPDPSDLDFIVDFGDQPLGPWGARLVEFAEALETLFGRHVDLVLRRSIRNPYFRQAVDSSRRLVYEARSE
jgi:uncharacterized protein